MTRSKALSIDRNTHKVEVLSSATNEVITLGYDKLVLATGSTPVIPNFKGGDLKGIFTLTDLDDTWAISRFIKTAKRKVVIIGAGLIGMEMAEAFIEKGAIQCGFCTPGMELSAYHLLNQNPRPTDKEIREGLSGNLCRCTGYNKIVEAISASAQRMNRKTSKGKRR